MARALIGPDPAVSVGGSAGELVEVCARQADSLAAQLEAAHRAVAEHLDQLDRGQLEQAVATGCWLGATLRVVAASLGELHTVLDEAAARMAGAMTDVGCGLPAPRDGQDRDRTEEA